MNDDNSYYHKASTRVAPAGMTKKNSKHFNNNDHIKDTDLYDNEDQNTIVPNNKKTIGYDDEYNERPYSANSQKNKFTTSSQSS